MKKNMNVILIISSIFVLLIFVYIFLSKIKEGFRRRPGRISFPRINIPSISIPVYIPPPPPPPPVIRDFAINIFNRGVSAVSPAINFFKDNFGKDPQSNNPQLNNSQPTNSQPVQNSLNLPKLSFAPVPNLSSQGFIATQLGDAFANDIRDQNVLRLANMSNNYMRKESGWGTDDFVNLCSTNCNLMNTNNRNCDGFFLEYDGSNKANPVNGCWLKNGKTGLNGSQNRIAYFLNFAPVPDLSSAGYSATDLGDAFSRDINDPKILKMAGITNNRVTNPGLNTNDFTVSCASKCDMMNRADDICPDSNTNRNCDGFVLEYNSSNKTNPVNSCWLKTGPTGLNSSKERIAYFKI